MLARTVHLSILSPVPPLGYLGSHSTVLLQALASISYLGLHATCLTGSLWPFSR